MFNEPLDLAEVFLSEIQTGLLASVVAPTARSKPYTFRGRNLEFLQLRAFEKILAGPAETGKTICAVYLLNQLCWEYPGLQAVILRKEQTTTYSTVLQTYENRILPYPPSDPRCPVRAYGGMRPEQYLYPNGSVIWVGGMDKAAKVLGGERHVIYINQAEQLELTDWETVVTRATGRGEPVYHETTGEMLETFVMGDCNPEHPTHWIRLRERTGVLKVINSRHIDNPTLYTDDGQLTAQGQRSMASLASLTGSRRNRLYMGLWAAPEGAIYDVFDEDRHTCQAFNPPRLWPRVVGIDPFGAHVAGVWLAYDPENQILNVYKEYKRPFGETTPGHVKNMIQVNDGDPIFAWVGGGPSERQARLDWHNAGIPLLEPPISEVWSQIDRVYQLLASGNLVIHKSCTYLLDQIGSYRRKADKHGNFTDEIENKNVFDMLDALRYAVAWLTYVPETHNQVVHVPVKLGNY